MVVSTRFCSTSAVIDGRDMCSAIAPFEERYIYRRPAESDTHKVVSDTCGPTCGGRNGVTHAGKSTARQPGPTYIKSTAFPMVRLN
nr:hypothetical protein CFP56_07835 [Quercus suber]